MSTADLGLQETEVPDKGKHHRKGWVVASILVVLVLIGLLIAYLYALNGNNKTSTAQYGDVPADIAELIANPPNVDCSAIVKKADLPMKGDQVILEYIPNAVGNDAKTERAFSDAVNVPAQPTTRDRILASVCSQPEYAGMIGVALATKVEVNGVSLSSLNKGILGQFKSTTPKAWADKVFAGTISYDDATETMTQLAGFMTIFKADKVEAHATLWNFRSVGADRDVRLHPDATFYTSKANVRTIVLNDKQYTGDFLVFSLTEKGQSGCFAVFGINVGVGGNTNLGDQRIAGVSCNQPTTPKPRQSTPPTTPPTHVTPPPKHNPPPTKPPLEHKGPSVYNGWTPRDLSHDPLTDGQVSQRQKDAGETRGNVIDQQVPSGTQSGQTTPDQTTGTTTAPGATPGGDPRPSQSTQSSTPTSSSTPQPSDPPIDQQNTSQDDGGTSGATCVSSPVVTCP